MALPNGVTTATLTFGPYTDAEGQVQYEGLVGLVAPSSPIRHVATGAVVVQQSMKVVIGQGGIGSIVLPQTDQAGLSPSPFAYTITWQAGRFDSTPGNLTFALPVGAGTTVDFDTLAPAGSVVSNPIGVLSVNGKVGAVTLAAADVGADAAGAATATVAAEVTRADGKYLATAQQDSTMAALVGTPASATAVALKAAFVTPHSARTVFLGDSITVILSTPSQNKYGEGFATLTPMVAGQKLLFAGNAGVTNDTVQDIAARVQTDVIAKAPGRCFVLAGTNSTNLGASGATLAQSMSDYENNIIVPLILAGIEPIVGTIPPRTGAATGDAVTYKNTLTWNAFLHRLAQRRGLRLVDFYSVLVNPATGDYATGLSTDGVHPSPAGALLMAQKAATDLGNLPAHGLPLTKDDLSTINLLARGTFSGGMSGSRPTSWSSGFVNGTEGTISIVPKTGTLVGSWAQFAKAGTTVININQTISTGFAPGDKVAFLGKYEADTLAGGAYASVSTDFRDSGSATISSLVPINQFSQAYSDLTFYVEGIVPANCTSMRVNLNSSAAGTGNFRFGQTTLLNLTQLGIA